MDKDSTKLAIRNKALGIISGIEKMSPSEKKELPSKSFGENYNRLLEIAIKEFPEFKPYYPPLATLEEYHTGTMCQNPYSEICGYCSEISNLLS